MQIRYSQILQEIGGLSMLFSFSYVIRISKVVNQIQLLLKLKEAASSKPIEPPPKRITFFKSKSYVIEDTNLDGGPIFCFWIHFHISVAILSPLHHYSYRFQFCLFQSLYPFNKLIPRNDESLVNSEMILNLPQNPSPNHPDDKLKPGA